MWNTRTVQVIRKCDEGLGEVAGKLYTRISISLPPKTTLLGAERILRTVLVSSRVRSRNLRVLFHGS